MQVREQLEALLSEKARLAQEIVHLKRDNASLNELLIYTWQQYNVEVDPNDDLEVEDSVAFIAQPCW